MLKYALLLLVFWAVGLFPQRAEKAELKGFYKEITKKQQPSYYPMEFPYVRRVGICFPYGCRLFYVKFMSKQNGWHTAMMRGRCR
jgi:hypothetical protein